MKLIINKDEKDRMSFWISRRFYFSLLFELETFLEQLHITPHSPTRSKIKNNNSEVSKVSSSNQKINKEVASIPVQKKSNNDISALLENINISYIKEKKGFIFIFQSNTIEAESIFSMEQFLNFYNILKNSFPKGEWGII